MKNRQWLLARRPDGALKDSDFTFVEAEAPAPGEGEVLIRNLVLSCDPTQRAWIAGDTYLPAVKIGEVVRSFGAGRIESRTVRASRLATSCSAWSAGRTTSR